VFYGKAGGKDPVPCESNGRRQAEGDGIYVEADISAQLTSTLSYPNADRWTVDDLWGACPPLSDRHGQAFHPKKVCSYLFFNITNK
jgi:hypothetical protein